MLALRHFRHMPDMQLRAHSTERYPCGAMPFGYCALLPERSTGTFPVNTYVTGGNRDFASMHMTVKEPPNPQ